MSSNRSRRIDHDTAEQLLGGHGVGAADGHEGLAGLLSAAAAPAAADGELPGQRAALAAFRAHVSGTVSGSAQETAATSLPVTPVRETRRRPMLVAALAQLLSAKAAVAVAAGTALGGFALAAGTGTLPGITGPASGPDGVRPSPSASGPALRRAPDGLLPETGARSSDLDELCRRYGREERGADAVAADRYAPLVAAAGGADRVPGYCAPVLGGAGASAGPAPSGTPTTPRPEATRPDGRPGSRPTPGKREHGERPDRPNRPSHPKPDRPARPKPGHTKPAHPKPTRPAARPHPARTKPADLPGHRPAPAAKGRAPDPAAAR
ncbi:hypothetical protein LG634_35430 [Streptomyces bambusae]|uniref:hypothetical protein n=1 Tax=Streptomyces bambusae TaxID=1550616 RepID=UPI001CFF91AE|nr:hypothetical protein [Streptomyces bambusae]MCB5170083.1 hypothetical protein [Streptomyces bambusae]